MFVGVCWLLIVGCCLLCSDWCLLRVVRGMLFDVRLLFVVCCVLIGGCSLFVVS